MKCNIKCALVDPLLDYEKLALCFLVVLGLEGSLILFPKSVSPWVCTLVDLITHVVI